MAWNDSDKSYLFFYNRYIDIIIVAEKCCNTKYCLFVPMKYLKWGKKSEIEDLFAFPDPKYILMWAEKYYILPFMIRFSLVQF